MKWFANKLIALPFIILLFMSPTCWVILIAALFGKEEGFLSYGDWAVCQFLSPPRK